MSVRITCLYMAQKLLTIGECVERSVWLSNAGNRSVSNAMRKLQEAEKVIRTESNRKAYFSCK